MVVCKQPCLVGLVVNAPTHRTNTTVSFGVVCYTVLAVCVSLQVGRSGGGGGGGGGGAAPQMGSSMLPLDKIVSDIVAMGFSHGQVGVSCVWDLVCIACTTSVGVCVNALLLGGEQCSPTADVR